MNLFALMSSVGVSSGQMMKSVFADTVKERSLLSSAPPDDVVTIQYCDS